MACETALYLSLIHILPDPRLSEVQQLVALVNEQLWIGHFDIWMQNGVVMFRHALLLAGGVTASDRQLSLIHI